MSYKELSKLLDAPVFRKRMKCSKKQALIFIEDQPALHSYFNETNLEVLEYKEQIKEKVNAFLQDSITPQHLVLIKAEVLEAKLAKQDKADAKDDVKGTKADAHQEPMDVEPLDDSGHDMSDVLSEHSEPGEQEAKVDEPLEQGDKRLPQFQKTLQQAINDGILVAGDKRIKVELRDNKIELIFQ